MNEEFWDNPENVAHEEQIDALMCCLKPRGKNVVECDVRTLVNHDIRDRYTWRERHAVCVKCGNEAWGKGDTVGHAKSALYQLRLTCPRGEKNFYFGGDSLLREEAEKCLSLRNKKDKGRLR